MTNGRIVEMDGYLLKMGEKGIIMDFDDLIHEITQNDDKFFPKCPFWQSVRYQLRRRQELWEEVA